MGSDKSEAPTETETPDSTPPPAPTPEEPETVPGEESYINEHIKGNKSSK